jgi:hypothetical protein
MKNSIHRPTPPEPNHDLWNCFGRVLPSSLRSASSFDFERRIKRDGLCPANFFKIGFGFPTAAGIE